MGSGVGFICLYVLMNRSNASERTPILYGQKYYLIMPESSPIYNNADYCFEKAGSL